MIKKHLPVFIILLTVLTLCLTNAFFGGFLTGWDNLHPEFNFWLNIKRSIFGAWQEYQGLGLLGGMGHASDLPRQIFLALLSILVPTHLIRQLYVFLMLFLGPLGMYHLLERKVLKTHKETPRKLASLSGALFYLLNLATVQAFYVPFEAFTHHFAALPWLFLVTLKFLEKPDRKNLALFVLVNIASLPQAYVPTIFMVWLLSLGVIFLVFLLKEKTRAALVRIFKTGILVLAINAFWLLPFLVFTLTKTSDHLEAMINQMGTENIILQNQKFGDLKSVALLKGFWFDNLDFDKTGRQGFMLAPWREHFDNQIVVVFGLLLFALAILGIFYAFKAKNPYRAIFAALFAFAFTLLANNTLPFSLIDQAIYVGFPVLGQALRFPFTKLSILAGFTYGVFSSFGVLLVFSLVKKGKNLIWNAGAILIFFSLLIGLALPAFSGHLLYSGVKNQIPQEYFSVFEFFQNQDTNTRIANFPQHTFWGWNFYGWGARGSGFIWYGIPQPILDRAFDVWGKQNENYYWEVSYAFYSQNLPLFEKVLEKYQINWLLIDENVINPSSARGAYFEELEKMAETSQKINLTATFGEIKLYQVNLQTPARDFVFLAQNVPVVGPTYKWGNLDQAYQEYGNYISNPSGNLAPQVFYPFRSLFTGKDQEQVEFKVKEKDEFLIFEAFLPEAVQGYSLIIPDVQDELIWVNPDNLTQTQTFSPEVFYNDKSVKVIFPKVEGYFAAEGDPTLEPNIQASENCNLFSEGEVENQLVTVDGKNLLRLAATNAVNCSAAFWRPNLPHKLAYLIKVESRYLSGKSLLFWLENPNIKKGDIETYLPKEKDLTVSWFVQPPMEKDGLGYALHFDDISIGQRPSVSDLGEISVNPLPYKFLTGLTLILQQENFSPRLVEVETTHSQPSYYKVSVEALKNLSNQILVLSQSYDDGWVAYRTTSRLANFLPFFGQKINSHVLANNWANGWILEDEKAEITIVFWPQYLEYFGFLLLVGLMVFVIVGLAKERR